MGGRDSSGNMSSGEQMKLPLLACHSCLPPAVWPGGGVCGEGSWGPLLYKTEMMY